MSTMFERAWAATGRAEGGYVNHPSDPGGETNHGITIKVARAHGYLGPMKDLTPGEARAIAKRSYWDALRLDDIAKISGEIAQEMFDTNFNMWYGAAGKFLQRALNRMNRKERDYDDVAEDGVVGPKTVAALAAFIDKRGAEGEIVMLRALNCQQGADYLRQAEDNHAKEDFVYGWLLNRVVV